MNDVPPSSFPDWTPPRRSIPAGDVPQYQPSPATESPAAPAKPRPIEPPPIPQEKPSRSQRPLIATGLAVAVGLSSLAFVLGRVSVSNDPPAVPVATRTAVVQPVATAPPNDVDPVDAIPETAGQGLTMEIPDELEPVAAVARQVGPAVVQIETVGGVGSGVIYDASGLILTAAHVVDGSTVVTVRLSDGTSVQGTVVGTHTATDIAVVSIPGRRDLPTAVLAIGLDPSIGSLAVALVSPFGLDQTVTAGVVSAVRTIGGVGMVQTDAAINPGNSGGPLVDRLGRVIGINDQIFTQSGANEGVGFAISIDIAALVADQLVAGDEVQLARLGVSSITVSNGAAGALVQEVVEGSAAEAAGLLVGDLIVAIDGRSIQDSGDLRAEIISTLPGTAVDLSVVRNGTNITVTAVLGSATF